MIPAKLTMIIAAELALLFAVICVVLIFKNRALKKVISGLQERMGEIVEALKVARAAKANSENNVGSTLKDYLSDQLTATKIYHSSLKSPQDIVLDIDPKAPLENRTAALRHAVLAAELEATTNTPKNETNWGKLSNKYDQIFGFYQDYAESGVELDTTGTTNTQEETDKLSEELTLAKKRINNLERFKQLYFELENSLEECKSEAEKHYNQLKELGQDSSDPQAFEQSLNAYHNSYEKVIDVIESGIESQVDEKLSEEVSGEIRHLRSVAADQHKIITNLQSRLRSQTTAEEKEAVVAEIQSELERQIRFVKESETCIHLMEEELNNANREINQLQLKLKKIPQIKQEFTDIRDQNDTLRDQVFSLKTANRRLTQVVKKQSSQPPEKAASSEDKNSEKEDIEEENEKLLQQISNMRTEYADLEEKFLDLKMQKT